MYKANLNGSLVNLTQLTTLEITNLKATPQRFTCPDCHEIVRLKAGAIKTTHFAHIKTCQQTISLESDAHRLGKHLMQEWINRLNPRFLKQEHRIESINRIADLYFILNEKQYVIEIQKSLISSASLLKRTEDYRSQNIIPIWIFITPVAHKKLTTYMPPLMKNQKHQPIIYLNVFKSEMTIYRQCLWVSQSECVSVDQVQPLHEVTLSQLCDNSLLTFKLSKPEWLEIKKQFRLSKWYYYQRRNWALRNLMAKHRLAFSLIGAEVGWPVMQKGGFLEPLFVWQTVVWCMILEYDVGDVFTVADVLTRAKYYLKASSKQSHHDLLHELLQYLRQLVVFDILTESTGYFEVNAYPKSFNRIDEALLRERELSLKLNCFK